jgi:branched-subunit amino acid ABC-type transport system permease component
MANLAADKSVSFLISKIFQIATISACRYRWLRLPVPVERYLVSRLYRRPELDRALLTIGIAFVAIALVNLRYGASFSAIELPAWLSGPVDLGFRSFPRHLIAVITLGFVVSAGLWIFIERSRFGIRWPFRRAAKAAGRPGPAQNVARLLPLHSARGRAPAESH